MFQNCLYHGRMRRTSHPVREPSPTASISVIYKSGQVFHKTSVGVPYWKSEEVLLGKPSLVKAPPLKALSSFGYNYPEFQASLVLGKAFSHLKTVLLSHMIF
jgi:hypothetical protein